MLDKLHEMLVADEIFLCGIVLFFGFVCGFLTRLAVRRWERRTL